MQIDKPDCSSMLIEIKSIVEKLNKAYAQSPHKDDKVGALIGRLKQTVNNANDCVHTNMMSDPPSPVILDPVTVVLGGHKSRKFGAVRDLKTLTDKLYELTTSDVAALHVNALGNKSVYQIQKIKNEENHGREENRNIESFK